MGAGGCGGAGVSIATMTWDALAMLELGWRQTKLL